VTSDEQIGQLLKLAGPRPMPDPDRMAEARAAAYAEWSRSVVRRRRARSLWVLTGLTLVTSTLLVATWSWFRPPSPPAQRVELGTIQAVKGSLLIDRLGDGRRVVEQPGAGLRAGDRIETPQGSRVGLAVAGGIDVRINEGSVAVLDTANRLLLASGTIYVDAGVVRHPTGFQIDTPLGTVRHVGTQFEVRLLDSALRVRVREGSIALDVERARWTSQAGEALLLVPGRPPERTPIATSGLEWRWLADLARPFRLEGASVISFLDWVSREQGWRWQFEQPATRSRVEKIVLHGSVDGLTPEEALAAVLPTCGLSFRLDGARLLIGLLPSER
jgi:hypothetical protein